MLDFVATESPLRDNVRDEEGDAPPVIVLPVRDDEGDVVCPTCSSHLLYVQEETVRKEWIVEGVVIHYEEGNLVEVDIPDEDTEGEVVDVLRYEVCCADETCDYKIPSWCIRTVD